MVKQSREGQENAKKIMPSLCEPRYTIIIVFTVIFFITLDCEVYGNETGDRIFTIKV